jgi:REP element-mobilizing transposase RayT
MKRRSTARQRELGFPEWGGRRKGAGRKRSGPRGRVAHARRALLAARHPVHVTLRLRQGLPSLRRRGAFGAVREQLARGKERFGFRLVHFSVQTNHVHWIVEAKDRRALARGVSGLAIRIARALNRLWARSGKLFADRYHDRILRSVREVRNAVRYVLENGRRHGIHVLGRDPCSSAVAGAPVAAARTWLLTIGWRRGGP